MSAGLGTHTLRTPGTRKYALLYRSPEEAGKHLTRPAIAIGNFDGVHVGHRHVIDTVLEVARRNAVSAAVLTFEPHPVQYFRPELPPFRLSTLEQKARLLESLGVDGVVAATFDKSIANLSPEEFVRGILAQALRASAVFVGADFRFGRNRAGDVDVLRSLASQHGIEVHIVEPVRRGDEIVSSTRIRTAVRDGDLPTATRLLGQPYRIIGRVVHGAGNGREFGYPTANIESGNPLLPPDGIYATRLLHARHGTLAAATYVGTRPTLGDELARTVEAYCLHAPADFVIYGDEVQLEFVERVRPDARFDSVDALIEQMGRDVQRIAEILEEPPD